MKTVNSYDAVFLITYDFLKNNVDLNLPYLEQRSLDTVPREMPKNLKIFTTTTLVNWNHVINIEFAYFSSNN